MNTYDISGEQIVLLKRCVRSAASVSADEADELIQLLSNPTCGTGDRLVTSASAFREFWDGQADEDEVWALETAPDSLIETFISDDYVYSAWTETCQSAMTELLHHLNKLKNGEGGLSLDGLKD